MGLSLVLYCAYVHHCITELFSPRSNAASNDIFSARSITMGVTIVIEAAMWPRG